MEMSAVEQGLPRKAQFCPFFIANGGHCPNGDQCLLLHDRNMMNSVNPAAAHVTAAGIRMKTRPPFIGRSTAPYDASKDHNHMVGSTPDANNGDQYFNATFQPMFPGVKTSRPNPIVAAPFNESQPPPQIVAPPTPRFMAPHPSQVPITMAPPMPQPGMVKMVEQQHQQNMMNSFNNLSLARELEHYKAAMQLNQGVNPTANEFVPKTMAPVIAGGTLSHSSSTPSFATMPGVQQQNNLHHHVLPLSAGTSPVHSPGLSPTHSPRVPRRQPESVVTTTSTASGEPAPAAPAPVPTTSATPQQNQSNGPTIQENVGGTTYFYTSSELAQQLQGVVPPTMYMYPGIPPHVAHMKPKPNTVSFGASDDQKLSILNKQAVALLQFDPSQNPDIPASVDAYEHLFPLEPPQASAHHKSPTIGYPTTCYRATGTKNGLLYCLRRVHGFRLTSTKCMQVIDIWKKVQHSNICQLREVFTTKGFGDHSIVFVYDFHPTATTMMSQHFTQHGRMNGLTYQFGSPSERTNARLFSGKGRGAHSGGRQAPKYTNLLPECLIWHYIIQLTSAIRTIHAAGLAFRVMDPTKIFLTNKYRLWLSCCGILDVLGFDAAQSNPLAMMPHYQQDDMLSLGKVVLALACNSIHAVQRDMIQTSVDFIARNYSADLKNLVLYLLSNHNRPRNVNDIMPMIGARFYAQLDTMQQMNDIVDNELSKELENSRLFRLVAKLGTVNDRPEFNMDPSWSETGDRYLLKLFRDYLFHQVDENGAPWVDMAHMVQTLNKLDAGSPEKICLVSRDQATVLVVTYAEVKVCLESAASQLQQASAASVTSHMVLS